MANSLVNDIIYTLKRDYGCSLELYIVKTVTPNLDTGRSTSDIRKVKINRAPVLSFIAANKNFTYGGLFGTSTRLIMIDTEDLPVDYEYFEDQYIIFENRRYNMKEMARYDGGYAFTVEEVKGQFKQVIYDFKDTLKITETVE